MTKNDMLTLISVNDEIYKIYDSIEMVFGDVSCNNLTFQHFTDMILGYTHTIDEECEEMFDILVDRTMSVEERYEKMGFDFPDVER